MRESDGDFFCIDEGPFFLWQKGGLIPMIQIATARTRGTSGMAWRGFAQSALKNGVTRGVEWGRRNKSWPLDPRLA